MNADGAQVSASGTARLILVVGVGRSGTSLLTGILGALGIRIPQPEIQADDTNPRGFGEPRWVVGFHRRLLRELRVTVNDARPTAWDLTSGTGTSGELRDWLVDQLANPGTVAVKDPRTVWFLPLWARTAEGMGVQPRYVTMLRHPAEIVRSAQRHYGNWQTDAGRAAGWLNVMLESERATRGGLRAFARYEDLLADWHTEVQRLGRQVELPELATAERRPAVDQLVDPSLHRNRARWDGLEVSEPLRTLAEQSWELVQRLVNEDGAEVRADLDAARAEYRRLYADAEAIASSSVVAARPRNRSVKARLALLVPAGARAWVRGAARRVRPPA